MYPTHISRRRERTNDYQSTTTAATADSLYLTKEQQGQNLSSQYHTYGQDEPSSHQSGPNSYGGMFIDWYGQCN